MSKAIGVSVETKERFEKFRKIISKMEGHYYTHDEVVSELIDYVCEEEGIDI